MRADPATLGASPYERFEHDAYFTLDADMCVKALLDAFPDIIGGRVLEPAAGVGHLVQALNAKGVNRVVSRDKVIHPNPLIQGIVQGGIEQITSLKAYTHVITNLPYDIQDQLLKHLLPMAARDGVSVAILTRAAWHFGKRRKALVHENKHFAGVVHLPRRPWWVDDRTSSPRHDFVWNVWSPKTVVEPTIYYPI